MILRVRGEIFFFQNKDTMQLSIFNFNIFQLFSNTQASPTLRLKDLWKGKEEQLLMAKNLCSPNQMYKEVI